MALTFPGRANPSRYDPEPTPPPHGADWGTFNDYAARFITDNRSSDASLELYRVVLAEEIAARLKDPSGPVQLSLLDVLRVAA